MNQIFKKLAEIPWVAELRRNRQIRLDAHKIANNWTAEDEQMRLFYGQFLSPGDLCFDIGANIGNRLKIFQKIGAGVIAVEPQRQCAQELRRCYGADEKIVIVEMAVSDSPGEAELMMSNFHMVSSLSPEWVSATQASGRFSQHRWRRSGTVGLTTMDALIDKYGMPRFAKIDVEGFEFKVVKGLTRPIPFISLEFTPETLRSSLDCLHWLASLGKPLFNFSNGESMTFTHSDWIDLGEMKDYLESLEITRNVWGDIYVSYPNLE